jgi:ankyrin repeat protein
MEKVSSLRTSNETTPLEKALLSACYDGRVQDVQRLLQEGVDVNTPNARSTPLHLASHRGWKDIVLLLLDSNAG